MMLGGLGLLNAVFFLLMKFSTYDGLIRMESHLKLRKICTI